MATNLPASISTLQADTPTDESPFRVYLPTTEPVPPDGELFVKVYEHVESLRKMGQHEEADKMDDSLGIAALTGIAGDSWKPFDVIWSAREFRETLYHTIAPAMGGPLWLRESLRIKHVEDLCMTLMPHVWKTLFDQAKDYINTFVDPHTPGHARLVQKISARDINMLKDLWGRENGRLTLDTLEKKFFPRASQTQRVNRISTSQVTGKTYTYSVKVLRALDNEEYTELFDCLARRAMTTDQTPLPPPVNWDVLSKLIREVGVLTNAVLRHIIFWFEGFYLADDSPQTPSRSWSDLLATGPFVTREFLDSGSSMHADKPPDEAARLFIQALFDQIRDKSEHGWNDETVKKLASQSPDEFFQHVKFASEDFRPACYRDRFQIPAWRKVVDLVKSYVGSQFQGIMEVYNDTSTVMDTQPQNSLQSAIQQVIGGRLQCIGLPFLVDPEALLDLTSEIHILTAMYLYRRYKQSVAGSQEAISSGKAPIAGDDAQHASQDNSQDHSQDQNQNIQLILNEATRILGDSGYDPQPEMQGERLDRFCLQRLGFLLAEFNGQKSTQAMNQSDINNTVPANLTGTVLSSAHEDHPDVLTSGSMAGEPDLEQEQEHRGRTKKRRRN